MMATKKPLPRTRTGNMKGLTDDVVKYWIERLLTPNPEPDSQARSSMSYHNDTLRHYGHWTLAEGIRDARGRTRLVLVNADRYSGSGGFGTSTDGRTREAERASRQAGLETILLPFSALAAAGIDHASIEPLEILEDRWTTSYRTVSVAKLPQYQRDEHERLGQIAVYRRGSRHEVIHPNADGTYSMPDDRHWLGEALFRAKVGEHERRPGTPAEIADGTAWRTFRNGVEEHYVEEYKTRTAKFLSAFDHQEARDCYFLCELPRTAAITVDEAFEALKPKPVVAALNAGLPVTRQGDIFAIPTSVGTLELKSRAKLFGEESVRKGAVLLNTNHTASQVIVTKDGETYARGILRHTPQWREPDHARQKMGDAKTWHRILKNTVPVATAQVRSRFGSIARANQSGSNRAWTLGGAVD